MTKPFQAFALIIFLASGLIACQSTAHKPGQSSQTTGQSKKVAVSKYPYWVEDPSLKGHIGVVGSAIKQDWGGKQAQHRVAIAKARSELAKAFQTHIDSVNRLTITDRGGQASTEFSQDTTARSKQALRLHDATVLEEWTDPDTGELFIWLVLPK